MAGDRVLTVRIAGDPKGAVGAIGTVEGATAGLGKKLLKMGALFAGLNFGANMVRDFVDVGKAYTESMNVLQVASKATDQEMEKVRKTAKDLGADLTLPGVSAADAASAMTEIVKSGYSVQEAMDAAQGSLQLAGAANIDAASAAGIMADALSMFQLKGKQANSVADRLAQTTNAVSGEITDTAEAFKNAGPVWSTAGMTVDELTSAIGMLAVNGIRGAEAGTTLKTMLMRLQAPTGKAKELIKELGIEIYDSEGNMKSFRDIIAQYSKATKGMTQQERDKTAAVLFGTRAIKGANLTLARGVKAYDTVSDKIRDQASAAETAAARNKGFGGAVDQLESQIESLYLIIWEKAAPAMEKITRKAAAALEAFNDFADGGVNLAQSLNDIDGKELGKALSDAIEEALDVLGDMSGKLADTIGGFIEDVDWMGLGIELTKAIVPMLIGVLVGVLNGDWIESVFSGMKEHWQAILWATIGLIFMPAKWAAKLAGLLRKIPFVGKFLGWMVESLNKIGGKLKGWFADLGKIFLNGFKDAIGYTGPGLIMRLVKLYLRIGTWIVSKGKGLADKFGKVAKDMAYRFGAWLANHGPKQAVQALGRIKSRIFGFLSRAGSWLVKYGAMLLRGLWQGYKNWIGTAMGGIRSIKDRVLGFFSRAGSWLYNSGKSIIQGLIDGILSKIDDLVGAVKGAVDKARDYLPFSPAKKGPFSGKGWTTYSGRSITEGLASGIESRVARVEKASLRLAKAASPEVRGASLPDAARNGALAAYKTRTGLSTQRPLIRRSAGDSAPVVVKVAVAGNIIGEKDFAKRVTPVVRDELVKIGNRNSGRIFE